MKKMKTKTLNSRNKLMNDIKNAINIFNDYPDTATIVSGIHKTDVEIGFETSRFYFSKDADLIGVKNALVLNNGYKIKFDDDCMLVFDNNFNLSSLRDYDVYNVSDLSIVAYKLACK